MPYYDHKGRLVYFRLTKAHIGLYIPPPVIEEHKNELADYETAKATVRFSLDKKLPITLIKKLVKDRSARFFKWWMENELLGSLFEPACATARALCSGKP